MHPGAVGDELHRNLQECRPPCGIFSQELMIPADPSVPRSVMMLLLFRVSARVATVLHTTSPFLSLFFHVQKKKKGGENQEKKPTFNPTSYRLSVFLTVSTKATAGKGVSRPDQRRRIYTEPGWLLFRGAGTGTGWAESEISALVPCPLSLDTLDTEAGGRLRARVTRHHAHNNVPLSMGHVLSFVLLAVESR